MRQKAQPLRHRVKIRNLTEAINGDEPKRLRRDRASVGGLRREETQQEFV